MGAINLNNEALFYVYVYLDPRKPGVYKYEDLIFDHEPFYVGKGKNNRKFDHINKDKSRNLHKKAIINKIINSNLYPIIIEYKNKLTEEEAYALEIDLINKIGTSEVVPGVNRRGPLTNLAIGGRGGAHPTTELIRKNISNVVKKRFSNPEEREKISLSLKGRIPWNKGKTLTLEHRKKCSEALKGKPVIPKGTRLPETWCKNIGLGRSKKNEKYYVFTSPAPENKNYIVLRDTTNGEIEFKKFLKEHNISLRALYRIKFNGAISQKCIRGETDENKKWKIRLATIDEIESINDPSCGWSSCR